MSRPEQIRKAVFRSVDVVNDLLPLSQNLDANDALVLIGADSALDSMGFVNFVVALEEELEQELGCDLNIADLIALQDGGTAPAVSTIGDLINLLSERLG